MKSELFNLQTVKPKIVPIKIFIRFWKYNMYEDRLNTILNSFFKN